MAWAATVRAASARGLEYANPPAPLVRLFAVDEIAIALPVLRSARLTSNDWIMILPELAPAGRAVLRNRRDLSPAVRRALESYGPIDFVLPDESVKEAVEAVAPEPVAVADDAPVAIDMPEPAAPAKKIPANSNKKHEFKTNDHVVYPTPGVGKVAGIEEKEVAGTRLELFIIEFEKDH